jgi:hypothetical protein
MPGQTSIRQELSFIITIVIESERFQGLRVCHLERPKAGEILNLASMLVKDFSLRFEVSDRRKTPNDKYSVEVNDQRETPNDIY